MSGYVVWERVGGVDVFVVCVCTYFACFGVCLVVLLCVSLDSVLRVWFVVRLCVGWMSVACLVRCV